ncbi:MAG: secretin N-terminal domain-containing protein [Pirellulaceae bacterium]
MKCSLHYLLATALTLALSIPMAAKADEDKSDKSNNDDKQAQAEKSEKEKDDKDKTKGLKTFTLKHRKPQEIRQLVMMCEGMHGPQAGLPRTTTGFRGTATPPGQEKISVAIDDQKKLVMVRGEEKHLEQVEKLVSQLDVPDDELQKIELEKVTLIPLKKETAQRANAALSQLQLRNHHLVSMGEVTLIAVLAGEEDSEEQKQKCEQAKEVISKFAEEDKDKDDKDKDDENEKSNED